MNWKLDLLVPSFLSFFVLTRRVRRLLPILLCRYDFEDSSPGYPSDREYVLKQPPFSFCANALWLNRCGLFNSYKNEQLRIIQHLHVRQFRNKRVWFLLRDGPLEKLWGEFEPQEFFFVIKFLLWIFLGHSTNIFLGLIGMHEFFSCFFPLREYFFCTSKAPPPPLPHKFFNGPSLVESN